MPTPSSNLDKPVSTQTSSESSNAAESINPAPPPLPSATPESRQGPEKTGETGDSGAGPSFTANAAFGDDAPRVRGDRSSEVYKPRAPINPVIAALKERDLYRREISPGKHEVICPWVHEHTDRIDTGSAYFEPDLNHPFGRFHCLHTHGKHYGIQALTEHVEVTMDAARHRPRIRLVPGEMNLVTDAAERVLAERANVFQAGGLIVTVVAEPTSGDATIVAMQEPALTKELAGCADWERFDPRSRSFLRCDPSPRHVSLVYKAQRYVHLPQLAGLTRQPYFRPPDGVLVTKSGYDPVSRCFGVFDEHAYVFPTPTREAAIAALTDLEGLISEVSFASPEDKAAALAAMLTAAMRTSIDYTPAFHVNAPGSGSGKSYLCGLITAFAGPGDSMRVAYPVTQEEANKVILALLLKSPAAIEFDDMQNDWLPHGTINSMLTAPSITGRILGTNKTVTVRTNTLVLGSGNNVGPVRDTTRRVVVINLDTRRESPTAINYKRDPLKLLHRDRAGYVTKALTISAAWRAAGSPRANLVNIATYDGMWTDYCRHPLVWLGQPDPAAALINRIHHDPDREALRTLLAEWFRTYGSSSVTVRKVISEIAWGDNSDLRDAIHAFPLVERGEVNPGKFGWFLKKNLGRIVAGLCLKESEADGRKAWQVVNVGSGGAPVPPASTPS